MQLLTDLPPPDFSLSSCALMLLRHHQEDSVGTNTFVFIGFLLFISVYTKYYLRQVKDMAWITHLTGIVASVAKSFNCVCGVFLSKAGLFAQ